MKPITSTAALLIAIGAAIPAHAGSVLVYEGFQYNNVGDELIGQPNDAGVSDVAPTGLSGTWSDAAATSGGTAPNDMFIKSDSLSFSNLVTAGNHIGFSSNLNNDVYNIGLDSTATTGITDAGAANGSIYFSFLFEKLQNNNNADREGFALMNGILPQSRFDGTNNAGALGREGFAIAAVGDSDLRAIAYDGTTGTRIVGTNTLPITVVNGNGNTSSSNVAVSMIVGEILFNSGTGGADVFRLYNVIDDGDIDATDLVLIDTIEANVDESSLNTLNLTRQVNVNYDEIRIGTSLNSVLGLPSTAPIPSPSAALAGLIGLGGMVIRRRRR